MMNIIKAIYNRLRPRRALICDLDGTLITTRSGNTFPTNTADWKIKDGIIEAINRYRPDFIHVVSNQGGIEYGYIKERDFLAKWKEVRQIIITCTNVTPTMDYCPFNDPKNTYRKPNAGMVEFFMTLKQLEHSECLMIGDASGKQGQFADSDLRCAENAQIDYKDVNDFIDEYAPCTVCKRDTCTFCIKGNTNKKRKH